MATIEETIISPIQQRAIDYCDKKQMPKIGRQIAVVAYMHGAQEERERCIKAMRDAYIKVHGSPCVIETIEKLARKTMEE